MIPTNESPTSSPAGKPGVLLINLGSPDSPSVPDVRKYLREFLMDGRVLDSPWPIRWAVVNLAILPKRPVESAEAYKKVWTSEGSPLVVTSRNVQREMQRRFGGKAVIELAMRYQSPSIESAISRLHEQGVTDLLVFPLFPHYAMSSFETAVVRAQEVAARVAPEMTVKVAAPYFGDPDYIAALAASAADFLGAGYDHLLFSFHGLPERHMRKANSGHCLATSNCCETAGPALGTCYRAQCFATVRALVRAAGIPADKYSVAFQSRLGSEPWLKPYTDVELARLAESGVKKLLVICPAFVSDCLETLEEIAMRGEEIFLEAGGREFELIPCLNEHPRWLDALESMLLRDLPPSKQEHGKTQPKRTKTRGL
jgi:ferrochelatase